MWIPPDVLRCLLMKQPCSVQTLPGIGLASDSSYAHVQIDIDELRPKYPNTLGSGISGAGVFALGKLIDLF